MTKMNQTRANISALEEVRAALEAGSTPAEWARNRETEYEVLRELYFAAASLGEAGDDEQAALAGDLLRKMSAFRDADRVLSDALETVTQQAAESERKAAEAQLEQDRRDLKALAAAYAGQAELVDKHVKALGKAVESAAEIAELMARFHEIHRCHRDGIFPRHLVPDALAVGSVLLARAVEPNVARPQSMRDQFRALIAAYPSLDPNQRADATKQSNEG